jgi:hypothetical protein
MDTITLTTRVWILLLRWALHITVAPEAVEAITTAASTHAVPVVRLFALCFVESTLGQGPRTGLLCGYQGRISAAERAAWPFGGEVARSNVRWQAEHAAGALDRWHDRVCTRGSEDTRWTASASFYNTGLSCTPNDYARRVAGVARRIQGALERSDEIVFSACVSGTAGEVGAGSGECETQDEAPCEH